MNLDCENHYHRTEWMLNVYAHEKCKEKNHGRKICTYIFIKEC